MVVYVDPLIDLIFSYLRQSLRSKTGELIGSSQSMQNDLQNIKYYMEKASRERSKEQFALFIHGLNDKIQQLLSEKSTPDDRLIAIKAIDTLIDLKYDDNSKITRFRGCVRSCLTLHIDTKTVAMISKVVGKLARVGSPAASKTLTAEWVDFESKRALEWLEGDSKSVANRYAAVLILKEFAQNAPTLFYTHVGAFLVYMWHGIRDQNETVRYGSISALRAVLALIAERQSTVRAQWYHDILSQVIAGFSNRKAIEIVHGSLLVVGELLRNTGQFMVEQFETVTDMILTFSDHKDKQIKKSVIQLIPQLSRFYKKKFWEKYLERSMKIMLKEVKSTPSLRATTFISLGDLAIECHPNFMKKHIPDIISAIKDGLTKKKRHYVPESMTCLASLAKAMGSEISSNVLEMLDLVFSHDLSPLLTDSLKSIAATNPDCLAPIQKRLLDSLSLVLAKMPYNNISYRASLPQVPEKSSEDVIVLALKTLGQFEFSNHDLVDFLRDAVVSYLQSDNVTIKKEAAVAICKLLLNNESDYAQYYIGEMLIHLLAIGIADPDFSVRYTVLKCLDEKFDKYLSIADNMRQLFIALNDEHFEIRERAVRIIGRLSTKNPAYVLPSLRQTLLQLLTQLQFAEDARSKEEAARMLSFLLEAAPRLIKPYVSTILKILMQEIRSSDATVCSCVLQAVGKLAIVGGKDIVPKMEELLPLVIDALQDLSTSVKRAVAVQTLGQIIETTGFVISPYHQYPDLLDNLLNILKSQEEWRTRKEVIKVLGIIGAIAPRAHKSLYSEKKSLEVADMFPDFSLSPSSDEYYPNVAFTALMKILSDPSLSAYHKAVVQAVLYIFTSLGVRCVPYLSKIMTPFLQLIRTSDSKIRKPLFQKLSVLVTIVRHHIRNYLKEIFGLIVEFWDSDFKVQIITLEESICLALNEEFKPYLSHVVPNLMEAFASQNLSNELVVKKGLHALNAFGKHLHDFLHLVIPAVVRLFEDTEASDEIKIDAMRTIRKLSSSLDLFRFSSRIIHPLLRCATNSLLQEHAMNTLAVIAKEFNQDFKIFIPVVSKCLIRHKITHPLYEQIESCIKRGHALPDEITIPNDEDDDVNSDPQVNVQSGKDIQFTHVSVENLRDGWKASHRTTKDDWDEWIRGFSVVLLKESPSRALRSCASLAEIYHPLARDLFNAGFVSCWNQLDQKVQREVVNALEIAFSSPFLPGEVLQTLLNLAEFMEHDEKPLPIAIKALGLLAEQCQCYAKALHYKEIEFLENPEGSIEQLIIVYNQLQQHEAAMGLLNFSRENFNITMKDDWYEKLQRWEKALEVYEAMDPSDFTLESIQGNMRCLKALGEWELLHELCGKHWKILEEKMDIAKMSAEAAWNMEDWKFMEESVNLLPKDTTGCLFRSVLAIHHHEYEKAQHYINQTRQLLDADLLALVSESYDRAYDKIIIAQQLSEMEEIINSKQQLTPSLTLNDIRSMWEKRLRGCSRNVEHWQQILLVRRLVLKDEDDMEISVKFASLCRKNGKLKLSHKTLSKMIHGFDPMKNPEFLIQKKDVHPHVVYHYLKHLWDADERVKAFNLLQEFVPALSNDPDLKSRCYLRLGLWERELLPVDAKIESTNILDNLFEATECNSQWFKVWHYWAMMNQDCLRTAPQDKSKDYLLSAIRGFFRSISLSPDNNIKLQDILRLLTLWFNHGKLKSLDDELISGFEMLSIDTWLDVIPQIIARINSPISNVRSLIHSLIDELGQHHPQALVYPLTVCSKSNTHSRKVAADQLLNRMRIHSNVLVEQAVLVGNELIRIAVLWNEMWREGLEEASRMYYQDHNIPAMLNILEPLHQKTSQAETLSEVAFQQTFGRDLQDALQWVNKYKQSRTKREQYLNQAWDCYYHVFRRIDRQLLLTNKLELHYVSPKLVEAQDLSLAVPGTYRTNGNIPRIAHFSPILKTINSKQRPRKLTISGNDGHNFGFLLKGHEDLRQDERVMQLFGLVNTLLANHPKTSIHDYSIKRYSVIPLSSAAGLIGWVENCDTLHKLIKEYRESRNIVLNIEQRLAIQMAPNFDSLTLMQKIEIFQYSLSKTSGQDLHKILWLKSRSSEVWLDRRTMYTRSLAVMSMVGYILGLGDRHPSNLMLEQHSGKIVHIDFGDCFEVAQTRTKFPETVPFRLTRMLINAMEVCGIEGTFRCTCEAVMDVLRENKDSVMAMLEAFVHDPLINWRLLEEKKANESATLSNSVQDATPRSLSNRSILSSVPCSSVEESEPDATTTLNHKAIQVINRIEDKLRGSDFGETVLQVPEQINRLIDQATSHSNLVKLYSGWCSLL